MCRRCDHHLVTGEPTDDVVRYYGHTFDERDRLTSTALGRLEFERTVTLLRRHLPSPPATVLDVGGGTGIHAGWLAAGGWDVRLYDLVPSHVAAARSALPHVPAEVADARALPLVDAVADAVLLLGPLYHLIDPADRHAALVEARRVTKPDGALAAAAIGRSAEVGGLAVDGKLTVPNTPSVEHAMRTGVHDTEIGFTTAYFHRVDELRAEVEAAGWEQVRVFGVEGPTWHAVRLLPADADISQHVRVADLLDQHPETATVSRHLLAVATHG